MSGLIAAASAAANAVITVTVGADGVPNYGYGGTFGSRSPTVLYGQTISAIYCQPGSPFVQIQLTGVVAATFFNRVTFKYGVSGATALTLTSASATFTTPGGTSSLWAWSATSTFTVTDNGLARFVIFYR